MKSSAGNFISLCAENARLKKQSSALFPNEEKVALERHIRHLEQVIKTNDALTIIETARMQHKNVYDTIEAAFTK